MSQEKINYELIDYEILQKARVSNGLSDRNILVPIEMYVGKKIASFDNLFSNNQDVNISSITQQELESKGKSILHKLSLALLLKGSFEIGDYSVDLYKISEKEYLSGLKDISKSQFYNDLPDFLKHIEIIQNIPVYESAAMVVSALSVLLGLYIGSKEKQTTALDKIVDFSDSVKPDQLKYSNVKHFLLSYEWLYRFNILYDNLSKRCKEHGKKSIDFLKDFSNIILLNNFKDKVSNFFNFNHLNIFHKTKELITNLKSNFSFLNFNKKETFRKAYKKFKFNLHNNNKIYQNNFNELNFFKNVVYNTHKDIEFKKTSVALNFAITTLFEKSDFNNDNILDKIKNRKKIKKINKSYEILKQISELSDHTSSATKSSIFLVQSEIAKFALKAIENKESIFNLSTPMLESIQNKIHKEIFNVKDTFFIDFYTYKANNINFLLLEDNLNNNIPNYFDIFQNNINISIKKAIEINESNDKIIYQKVDKLKMSFDFLEEISDDKETIIKNFKEELFNINYIYNIYKDYVNDYDIKKVSKYFGLIELDIKNLQQNINIDTYINLIKNFNKFIEKTNQKIESHFNEKDFENIVRLTKNVIGERYPYILKIKDMDENILQKVNNYFEATYFPFQDKILYTQEKIDLGFSKKNMRAHKEREERAIEAGLFKIIQIEEYVRKDGKVIKAHTKQVWKDEESKRKFYSRSKI